MNQSLRIEENSICRYRRISGGGIRVIWELTGRCNLRCKHCFASVLPESKEVLSELTTEEVISVIKQFDTIPISKVMLTGGEVFVRSDVMTIIRSIREIAPKIVIDITTNALLIHENIIAELVKYNVDELSISLDGTYNVYRLVRGSKVNFSQLIKNIRLIIASHISVDGIMVLNKLTFTNINETVALAAKLGLSSFTIANLESLPHSDFDYENLKLSERELEASLKKIDELQKEYKGKLIIRQTGFINCSGYDACINNEIIAIDRNGMYCHCLNVYKPDDIRLDSRIISLRDAFNTINYTIQKDRR